MLEPTRAVSEVTAEELPAFNGEDYESHVQAWVNVSEEVEERRWMLAAVAASLVTRYGENTAATFAADVGVSRSLVSYYAKTYTTFQSLTRVTILGFRHHQVAARSEDPQKAIDEANDKLLSTRQMEVRVEAEALPIEERQRVVRAAEERRLSGEDTRRLVRARIEKREKEEERERERERTAEEVVDGGVSGETSGEEPTPEEIEQGRRITAEAFDAEVQEEIEEILEVCPHCGAPSSAWERRPEALTGERPS